MTFTRTSKKDRGFTLIELLVVIAIIGLLSSIVLASLNGARKKGRDARRLADLKQLQVALELYYSSQASPGYPVSTTVEDTKDVLTGLVSGGHISALPDDPLGGAYHYVYKTTAGGTFYCLGTAFEGTAPASSCNTGATGLNSTIPGVGYTVGP